MLAMTFNVNKRDSEPPRQALDFLLYRDEYSADISADDLRQMLGF
jgi:hypothetical protein